jgi:hypothetical protein
MSKPRGRYNLRLIKASWPYSLEEAATLLGVHENTVTRWLNDGLRADRSARPTLVRGDALIAFLAEGQSSRRRKCEWDEFYCFKCREPRRACLGIIDITIENSKRFRAKTICEACETSMTKVQSMKNLQKFLDGFHVHRLEGDHLIEGPSPSVNGDKEALE